MVSANWAQYRKDAGFTLQQAAEQSGYGATTINGLEKRGEGSERLKTALALLYGLNPSWAIDPGRYQAPMEQWKKEMSEAKTPEEKEQATNRYRDALKALSEEDAADVVEDKNKHSESIDWMQRALIAEQKLKELKALLVKVANEE